jgi:hypothetical protein
LRADSKKWLIKTVVRLGKQNRTSSEANLEKARAIEGRLVHRVALLHRPRQAILDLDKVEEAISTTL